ncbi:hypothetical protein [Sanyastnella coralliicola]|uniref:hypothetical protein n=1 Tax=Sanyastnella coralliicola TaxID=3069118 RepID=UPI0027BAD1B1|nr:hypothetical protein [Longitalea sp. SCSIO 12813]
MENESNSDIQVVVQTTFDSVPDTIIVGAGERTVLTYLDQIGTVDEFEGCPLNWAQQIQFSVVDDEETEVLINPNNSSNWVYSVDTKNIIGAGQCSCKLDLLEVHVE